MTPRIFLGSNSEKQAGSCKIEDVIKEKVDTKNIKNLWGDLKPPIHIIYEAWDAKRWINEFNKIIKNKEPYVHEILEKLNPNERIILTNRLVSIGPHVITGDLFAFQYILLILTDLYDSNSIKFHDASRIDAECKKITEDKSDILKGNIVLIGGPAGNHISFRLLKKLGVIKSLFPDAPDNDLRILKWGTKEYYSPSMDKSKKHKKPDVCYSDCGLFLYGNNPWGVKTNFFAAMGSLSWGTQGAAAIACSEEGAKIILEAKDNIDTNNYKWLKGIGYVNVFRQNMQELPNVVVPECDIEFIWPNIKALQDNKQLIFHNPAIIIKTISKLQMDLESERIKEIKQCISRYLPYRRTYRISMYAAAIFIISIISFIFFNIKIIYPFWAVLGLITSCGFIIMSYISYLKWNNN